jgi:hypothetical protein
VTPRRLTPLVVGAVSTWLLWIAVTVAVNDRFEQLDQSDVLVSTGGTVLVSSAVAAGLTAVVLGRQVPEQERGQVTLLAASGAAGYMVLSALVPLLGGALTLGAITLAAGLAGPVVGGAAGFAMSHR